MIGETRERARDFIFVWREKVCTKLIFFFCCCYCCCCPVFIYSSITITWITNEKHRTTHRIVAAKSATSCIEIECVERSVQYKNSKTPCVYIAYMRWNGIKITIDQNRNRHRSMQKIREWERESERERERNKYNLESATSPIINTHKHVRSLTQRSIITFIPINIDWY